MTIETCELNHWNGPAAHVRRVCLQVSVSLLVAELRGMSAERRDHTRRVWVNEAGGILPYTAGDALMRPTPEVGEPSEPGTARSFNYLARAVAALAYGIGGVEVFGLLWCAAHSPGGVPGEFMCMKCPSDATEGPAAVRALREETT